MKEKKNVLVLSNFYPLEGWGGGVIIRSLTEETPEHINIIWANYDGQRNNVRTCNQIRIIEFSNIFLRGKRFFPIILAVEARLFVNIIKKLVKRYEIDLVWIITDTKSNNIAKNAFLAKSLKIPCHVSVHDDPIVASTKELTHRVKKNLGILLRNAVSIDVISERMKLYYKKMYQVNSTVVTRCCKFEKVSAKVRSLDKINILMGGYGNAPEPWPLPLVDAVTSLNNIINCQLHLFDKKLERYQSNLIKVYDTIGEKAFNVILQNMHLGYACDDLRIEKRAFAQLSLSTKVITYIGAKIPFVYHGPSDSTVGDLIKEYSVGIVVENNNAEDLQVAFLHLVNNYSEFQKNCEVVSEKLYSCKNIRSKFFGMLDDTLNNFRN